jgi:hypothetical protein
MIFSATLIDVECVFSQGRLLLLHVRSRLSVQSTCALLCLGQWSVLGLVKDCDIKACVKLDEVAEEEDLLDDWDTVPTL